ncbi:hypothetical protein SAMN05444172_2614 [Burkholderia sp. GAS332]|nr:hypothetical protein SAMN05444172_2614 [Burkholderia sp. GAS332]
MRTLLASLGSWAFVSVACAALWAFVRSDRAVYRLDAFARRHPFATWALMLGALIVSALTLVYFNTSAVPILSQGKQA